MITRRYCDHDRRVITQLREGVAATVAVPPSGRPVDGQVFTVRPLGRAHLEVEIIVPDDALEAVEVAALEEQGVPGAG